MTEDTEKYHNHTYTNFLVNEEQFAEEIKNPVLIKKHSDGVCWVSFKNGIYYLSYSVDNLDLLIRFMDYDLTEIDKSHGMLLELKFSNIVFSQNLNQLAESLIASGFIAQIVLEFRNNSTSAYYSLSTN